MKTLVLGASSKPQRYSYLAVNKLRDHGHEIVALGNRAWQMDDWEIITGKPELEDIHTVTLYLGARNQKEYYDYLLSLKPKRVIFNPGAENHELAELLEKNEIQTEEACTLVMLGTGQF